MKQQRRTFLKRTGTLTLGIISFPALLRAQVKGEKLGVAVVGFRGQGMSHIQAYLQNPHTVIRYLVDVDEKVLTATCKTVSEKQGFEVKGVKDVREILDKDDLQIVSTATPNHWHALIGVWAMQAGKDVYIEKPISHNLMEGASLIAAAKKYRRLCQVGTQCRSHKALHDAIEFIKNGGIGEVRFARGLCWKRRTAIGPLGDYEIPPEIDFNLWLGPAPFTIPRLTRPRFHYDWHWQRLYGNGDTGNQGPHQLDIARWGLGIESHPNAIIAYGGRLGYQAEKKDDSYIDAGDTPNTHITIFDYGDKCIVFETRGLSVDGSADEEINRLFQSERGDRIGVIFYGSEGYLVQRTYTHCIAYDKNFNVIKEFKGGGDHFANFVEAVRARDPKLLNSDAQEGHLSASMAHLANISYYLGEFNKVTPEEARKILSEIKSLDDNIFTLNRTLKHLQHNGVDLDKYPISMGVYLKFDPQKEIFLNYPEANKLLSREYREPFVVPPPDRV